MATTNERKATSWASIASASHNTTIPAESGAIHEKSLISPTFGSQTWDQLPEERRQALQKEAASLAQCLEQKQPAKPSRELTAALQSGVSIGETLATLGPQQQPLPSSERDWAWLSLTVGTAASTDAAEQSKAALARRSSAIKPVKPSTKITPAEASNIRRRAIQSANQHLFSLALNDLVAPPAATQPLAAALVGAVQLTPLSSDTLRLKVKRALADVHLPAPAKTFETRMQWTLGHSET
jgi:hypothetical protein